MRAACIWLDQCHSKKKCPRCQYYTPEDDTDEDVRFYNCVLEENVKEYENVIRQYEEQNFN